MLNFQTLEARILAEKNLVTSTIMLHPYLAVLAAVGVAFLAGALFG